MHVILMVISGRRTQEEFADRSRNRRVTLELGVADKALGGDWADGFGAICI